MNTRFGNARRYRELTFANVAQHTLYAQVIAEPEDHSEIGISRDFSIVSITRDAIELLT